MARDETIKFAPLWGQWRVVAPTIPVLGGIMAAASVLRVKPVSIGGLAVLGVLAVAATLMELASAARIVLTDEGVLVKLAGSLGAGDTIRYANIVRIEADVDSPVLRIVLKDRVVEIGPFPYAYAERCRQRVEHAAKRIQAHLDVRGT